MQKIEFEMTLEMVTELLAGKTIHYQKLDASGLPWEVVIKTPGMYMTLTMEEWKRMRDAARYAGMHEIIDRIESGKQSIIEIKEEMKKKI